MLLAQWIIRLGVLVVAVGIAPIALALHGTPQTEGAAKLWWRTILGTLGTVVMQAVALHTTLTIFLNPNANLTVLGLPLPGGDPGAVMNLLNRRLSALGSPQDPRADAAVHHPDPTQRDGHDPLRVVLVQQLTRGISRVFSSGRGAARAAPAARPAARAASGWPTR
jgi:hypothetical protein